MTAEPAAEPSAETVREAPALGLIAVPPARGVHNTPMAKWTVLVLVGVLGAATMGALDRAERAAAQREGQQRLSRTAARVAATLGDELRDAGAAVKGLAAFMLAPHTLPSFVQFDRYAEKVLAADRTIRAMAYADAQRVIRHFYPLRGNEAAIGLDLMRRPAAPYVKRAIGDRRVTVGKPVTTVQGTFSTIIRAPLYRDDHLLGLVQALIEVVPLVHAGASALDADMAYQVLDDEGARFLGAEEPVGPTAESPVNTGDRNWTLRVGWKAGAPGPRDFVLGLIWGGGGLLLVSLLYILKRAFEQHQWLAGALAQRTAGLASSETRLRAVMDVLPVGVWVTDKDGEIISANPTGRAIWGGVRYVGVAQYGEYKGWWHDTGEPIQAQEWGLARAVTRGETSLNEKIDIESFDGERKTILNSAMPFRDRHRNIIGAVVVNQDITERQQTEAALRASEDRYRDLVEHSRDLICTHDPDGRILSVNQWAARVLGYTPDELVGVNIRDVLTPEVRHEFEMYLKTVMSQGEASGIMAVETREGETRYWEYRNTVRKEGIKQPIVRGMAHDITERLMSERALRKNEALLRAVMDTLPVGVWVVDKDGTIRSGNPAGQEIWGGARYVGIEQYDEYKAWWHETGEPLESHDWAAARAVLQGEISLNEVIDIETFDGKRKTILHSAVPIRDHDNNIAGAVVVNQDITAKRVSEEEARRLSRAIAQTADAVVITDRHGVIDYVNDAFEAMTGYSRSEAIGRQPNIVKSGMHESSFYTRIWSTILGGETLRDVFINRRKNGDLYYEEKTITPLTNDRGEITSFISTGKDITERMHAQERLQFLAHHDALTSLPNRILFMDRLNQALHRAHWHKRILAVMFLDLDRFKNVNDSLGHNVGDELLQMIATRLSGSVREGDTVARLGGDEFAIVLEDIAQPEDVSMVAGKILHAFSEPYHVHGRELFISSSIGISRYPNDGGEADVLLKNADAAMYRAKEMGKNNYQFYSADMRAVTFEWLTMEAHLRHALERDEFELHYQPQVDLRTGTVMGMEALIRWRHPEFGLLGPLQFIGLAEETGMIGPIGDWVARTACEQLLSWQRVGFGSLRMAINVSGRQFNDAAFFDSVGQLLAQAGLDPKCLELEITEGVVMKNAAITIEKLHTLRALGVHFAIDDFGTGYSSLSYLRRFAINTLKIDKSFTMDIIDDQGDAEIVRAIIAMAHSLKLQVIAEGVESQEILDFLRRHECDAMQGYFFSRPLPAPEITHLLESGRHL